jgi:predicted nucleotidyltransferase
MNATRRRAIKELRRMVLDALGDRDAEVWLFGSCARDEVMQHSDIDIGILPHEPLPPAFLANLDADIEESSVPYDVDVVDLSRARQQYVDAVRREGIVWRK